MIAAAAAAAVFVTRGRLTKKDASCYSFLHMDGYLLFWSMPNASGSTAYGGNTTHPSICFSSFQSK